MSEIEPSQQFPPGGKKSATWGWCKNLASKLSWLGALRVWLVLAPVVAGYLGGWPMGVLALAGGLAAAVVGRLGDLVELSVGSVLVAKWKERVSEAEQLLTALEGRMQAMVRQALLDRCRQKSEHFETRYGGATWESLRVTDNSETGVAACITEIQSIEKLRSDALKEGSCADDVRRAFEPFVQTLQRRIHRAIANNLNSKTVTQERPDLKWLFDGNSLPSIDRFTEDMESYITSHGNPPGSMRDLRRMLIQAYRDVSAGRDAQNLQAIVGHF
ncbi:MAG: hypothetical protein IT557_15675 [Alphaproteobacteria bacterium]|nr:hypothetical protein [Alphaproteobacteria bacterium]